MKERLFPLKLLNRSQGERPFHPFPQPRRHPLFSRAAQTLQIRLPKSNRYPLTVSAAFRPLKLRIPAVLLRKTGRQLTQYAPIYKLMLFHIFL